MTNTQLKSQIDNQITNETVDFGITPTEVGNNIKSVVDYIDQEIGLLAIINKVVKITLSSADILALRTTPKLLIPAVTGKLLSLNFIHQRYTHLATPYVANGNGQIKYGTGINNNGNQFGLAITSPENSYGYNGMLIGMSGGGDFAGLAVYLGTTGSISPSGGDGSLVLYVEYSEITI